MLTRVRPHIFAVTAIVLLGLVAYANIINKEFVWDDNYLVRDNALIKHTSGWDGIFLQDLGRGSANLPSAYYRPLQLVSYAFDHLFSRSNPNGYHLDSIIEHILVALGLYWLALILYSDRSIAALSASLFVVHPVHTEAVAYISGRADPLSALFILLCVCCYVLFLRTKDRRLYALVLISACLALLSKEISLILPLLLLFYHWSFRKRVKIGEFIPIIALIVLYLAWRLFVVKPAFAQGDLVLTLSQRICSNLASLSEYLRLLLFPFPLHMEYGFRTFPFWHPKVLGGALFLCAGLWYLVRKNRNGATCFCLLWFFSTIILVNSFNNLKTFMAEHWLYFPSICFFILIARVLFLKLRRFRLALIMLVSAALGASLFLTIRQNHIWGNSIVLYEHTLKYAPDSLSALNNLGLAYSESSRYDEAVALFKKALLIDPRSADACNNLGKTYFAKGDINEAILYYKKAININPGFAQSHNNLGIAYSQKGDFTEAVNSFTQAIKSNPNFALSYFNLASTFVDIKRYQEALQFYEKAIEIDPDFAWAYSNLGFLYNQLGHPKKAIPLYKKALAINPRLAEVYNNLGSAYLALSRLDEARSFFNKTIEVDPDYAAAYNNLAVVYFYEKKLILANEYCEKALARGYLVNPEFLRLLKNSREN